MFWCYLPVSFFGPDCYVWVQNRHDRKHSAETETVWLASCRHQVSWLLVCDLLSTAHFLQHDHRRLNTGFVAQAYRLSLCKQTNFKGTPLSFVAVDSNITASWNLFCSFMIMLCAREFTRKWRLSVRYIENIYRLAQGFSSLYRCVPLNYIWRSDDHASWYILTIKPTRCTNFSNLFLE